MGLALEEWIALGGLGVAVAGVVVAVLQWRSGRPAPPAPPPARPSPLPALLRAQRAYAGALPYLAALGGAAPELAAVYVTLRAGRIERVAALSGPPQEGEPSAPAVEPRVTEVDLAEVIAAPGGAVLVGGAGSGKSTVVSRVVAEAAERVLAGGGTGGSGLPVVVPARLLGPSAELPRAVAAGLARTAGLAEDDLGALLAAPPPGGGHWLVIVDGLDEVVDGAERRDAVRRLASWLAEPGAPHRLVVTTRPPREGELAPLRAAGAAEFHLRQFDVEGLEAFARRWFAAVHPEGGGDLAGRFLARVATDRLGGLVRTPLLATIAAVVFGRSLDQPLPAGRASLYAAFVALSLRRRRSPRDVAETDPDDPRAKVWRGDPSGQALLWELFLHTEELLGHLADRRLAGDPTPLADLATAWATAPHTWSDALADSARARRLVAADPAWAHLVPALLAETGLVGPAGDGEFVHPSFTEYLAAAHRALDVSASLAAVADGATRGFGLFAVAAAVGREPAAAATVRELLDGDQVDLRTLAEILADGVPLDPEFQRRAAIAVVARCREAGQRYAGSGHEELVAVLVAHPFAAARLAEVAGGASEPPGFRGTAARLLAVAGRPEAVAALLPALDDAGLTDEERAGLAGVAARHGTAPVAARGLDALRAACAGDRESAAARDAAVALAEHGTPADRADLLARAAGEGPSFWRVLVAAALARHGDAERRAGAVRVLGDLLTTDILAVEPFAEHGGPDARRRLAAVATDQAVASGIRRAAVTGLLRFAPPDQRESIVDLARGLLAGAEPDDRASILDGLVTHAPGTDEGAAVAFARDPSVPAVPRGRVAGALLRDGAAAERGAGFDVLREIATDTGARGQARDEAFRRLAMYGGPPGRAVVAEAIDVADPPDVRLTAARGLVRHGDPEQRATGRRLLTALVEAGRAADADEWDFAPGHAAPTLAEEGTAADRAWLAQVGADAQTPVRLRGHALGGLFRFGTDRERAAARTAMERLVREAGDDWAGRGLVARELVVFGGPAERRTLRRWAEDSGLAGGVRYRAAEALADDGGPADVATALRTFAVLLDDGAADLALRHFAARDLYQHGGAAERADLVRRAEDRSADPRGRVLAAAGVQHGGDAAATRLAGAILAGLAAEPDADADVRADAVREFVEHGDNEAHDAAIRLAADPVLGLVVAEAFLTALRPVSDAYEAAAAAHLATMLRESRLHPDDSQRAADLLVRPAKAADTVLEVARDPAAPEANRLSAAYALYQAGHHDALAGLAADGTLALALRVPVGRWLSGVGEGAHRAAGLAALESIAADPTVPGDDRELAVAGLSRHFDNAVDVLTRLATTTPGIPADTRCGAAAALAEHGAEAVARRGAEVLADLAATGPTWWIRLHAVLSIQQHAPEVPVPTGVDTHPVVRAFAARHLANGGDPQGPAVLRAMFGEAAAPEEVRALAVAMLVEVGEPAEAVEVMSTPDLPALVRAEAAMALAEEGDPAAGAYEPLARLAGDPAAPDDVRAAVITWLSRRERLDPAHRVAHDPDAAGLPRLAAATALLAAGVPGAADAVLPDGAGGRLWLWALAALNQYGDEAERDIDLVAGIRYFAEVALPELRRDSGETAQVDDPLVRHLLTTDWYDLDEPPHDALRQEVVSLLMTMDGDPDLWREGAREVSRHGEGYRRLIARAVLREVDR